MKLEHKINRCLYQYLSLDDYLQEKVENRVNLLLDGIIEVLDNPDGLDSCPADTTDTTDSSDSLLKMDVESDDTSDNTDDWKPLVDNGYFRNFTFDDDNDVYIIINLEDKSRLTLYGSDMDKLNFENLQYVYGRFTHGLSFGENVTIYECNVIPSVYRKFLEKKLINADDTVQSIPPVVNQEVCHTDLGDIVHPIFKPTYTSLYKRKYDELDIQCCDRVIVHNIENVTRFFTSNKVDIEGRRHIKELDIDILKYEVTSFDGYAQFDLWVSESDYARLGDTRPLVRKCPLNVDTIVKFNSDTFDETEGVEFGFIRNEDSFKTLRYNDASFKSEYVLFKVDKEEMEHITDFIKRIEGE